jgi:signal transduction histidine kinase
VYFCVLEALQNVAKYAAASLATVELRQAGERLTFLVTDDGAGFDLAGPVTGSGLQGMRDRLAALGGSLTVSSAPGRGTTVAGALCSVRRWEGTRRGRDPEGSAEAPW